MSKEVLVMDRTNNCIECPFCYKADQISLGDFKYKQLFRCLVQPEDVVDVYLKDIITKKQDWCPLKTMPEKKEADILPLSPMLKGIFSEYAKGWNACIDVICREEK